jgi:hypothetical protein
MTMAERSPRKKPETSAALDRIARLGLASIAEYVRELHRVHAEKLKPGRQS